MVVKSKRTRQHIRVGSDLERGPDSIPVTQHHGVNLKLLPHKVLTSRASCGRFSLMSRACGTRKFSGT